MCALFLQPESIEEIWLAQLHKVVVGESGRLHKGKIHFPGTMLIFDPVSPLVKKQRLRGHGGPIIPH